jgi:hypothetical protein
METIDYSQEVYNDIKRFFKSACDRYAVGVYEGIENLLEDFDVGKYDFYTSPASTRYHGSFYGGLLVHSYLTAYVAVSLAKWKLAGVYEELNKSDIFLAAAMHDLCKCNTYKKGFRYYKGDDTNNRWVKLPEWNTEDKFPLGHGEKSVFILQKYVDISDDVACAIRFHMGKHEPGTNYFYPVGASYDLAMKKYPLVSLIQVADSYLTGLEREEGFYLNDKFVKVREDQKFKI